ncbi:MAG TPA: 30S ribosomal protein S18 [Candidatus Paceibacterota bacterium]|nr:30S ribosomal protein S18 [Candidatus Paceibacterota bacterium]
MKNIQFNNLKEIDYKDVELLKSFIDTHGRIVGHRRLRMTSRMQRKVALAIKRARFLGLLPYVAA